MPKKRHRESPFDPELVAAITKGLPAILAQEGYFKTTEPEPKPKQEPQAPKRETPTLPTPVPRGNTRFLWYSVFLFALVIIIIWGFNLRSIVNSVWGEKTGYELVNQSQDDFKAILETLKENDTIAKEKIRAANPTVPVTTTTTSTSTTNQMTLDSLVDAIKATKNP